MRTARRALALDSAVSSSMRWRLRRSRSSIVIFTVWVVSFSMVPPLSLFDGNDAEFAVALDASVANFCKIIQIGLQTDIFDEVAFGEVVVAHGLAIQLARRNDLFGVAFEQIGKSIGMEGGFGEGAMEEDDEKADRDGRQELRGTVDGAGKGRGENESHQGVEAGFLGEKAFVGDANHDEGGEKNNERAHAYMQNR